MSRIAILTVLFVCVGTPVVSQSGTVEENVARLQSEAARSRANAALGEAQSLAISSWTQAAGGVTYTLTGNLPPRETATSAPVLPVAVVNAVRNDGHLSSLRIGTGGRIVTSLTSFENTFNQLQPSAQPQFSATFNFADLAEFDDWYASRTAQDLHRAVESAAVPGSVQVNLTMNRPRSTEQVLSIPYVQPETTQTTGR